MRALLSLAFHASACLLVCCYRPDGAEVKLAGVVGEPAGADLSSETPALHVITFDRPDSLSRLLAQLNKLDYGADCGHVRLTIAIDFPEEGADAEVLQRRSETVALAESFQFQHGEKVVLARSSHAGLVRQWVDAWKPEQDASDQRPACMILEDDVVPSTLAWRWVREALAAYDGKTDRIASLGLQRPTLVPVHRSSRGLGTMPPDNVGQPFLYRLLATWGLVAVRGRWIDFRKYMDDNFVEGHPSDILFEGEPMQPSEWHSQGPSHMWSYWFIRFMKEKGLFTLYSNLGDSLTLCTNMKEPGLHYHGPAQGSFSHLLQTDVAGLHNFPELRNLTWYDWDAKPATIDFVL